MKAGWTARGFSSRLFLGMMILVWLGSSPGCPVAAEPFVLDRELDRNGFRWILESDHELPYEVVRGRREIRLVFGERIPQRYLKGFTPNGFLASVRVEDSDIGSVVVFGLDSPEVRTEVYDLSDPYRVVAEFFRSPAPVRTASPDPEEIFGLERAGRGVSRKEYFRQPLFTEDQVLESAFGYRETWFELPENWRLTAPVTLWLVLSRSARTEPELSGLTVDVNGLPVRTLHLDEERIWKSEVKVRIPQALLRPGSNSVAFRSVLRSGADREEDGRVSGNWLRLHGTSRLLMEYRVEGIPVLSDHPFPIFQAGEWSSSQVAVVVPDRPSLEVVSAVFDLYRYWSRLDPERFRVPRIVTVSEVTPSLAMACSLVFVMERDHMPAFLEKGFDVPPDMSDSTYLSTFRNKEGKGRMLITSNSGDGLIFGVRALQDGFLRQQMSEAEIEIPLGLPLKLRSKAPTVKGDIPLAVFFEGPLVFRGVSGHQQPLSFRVPPRWDLMDNPRLILKFRHSPLVDGATSSLSVEMDGQPLYSVSLGPENAREGLATVVLPDGVRGGDDIDLTLKVWLNSKSGDSLKAFDEAIWLVVEGDSCIRVPHVQRGQPPLLELLPSAFYGRNLDILMGGEISSQDISLLIGLLLAWDGGTSQAAFLSLEDLVAETPQNRDRVIVAGPDELIAHGVHLEVCYDPHENCFVPGGNLPVLTDFGKRTTLLSLRGSERGEIELVIAPVGPPPHLAVLRDMIDQGDLKGDTALVTPDGVVVSTYLRFPSRTEEAWSFSVVKPALKEFLSERRAFGLFVLASTVVLLFLAALFLETKRF